MVYPGSTTMDLRLHSYTAEMCSTATTTGNVVIFEPTVKARRPQCLCNMIGRCLAVCVVNECTW